MRPALHEVDRRLARQLADGDEAAFECFFREYFPRLYRFVLARVGPDPSIVEDVVQETLAAAINHMHHYRGEATLFSWLCTICRRTLARREKSDRQRRDRVALIEDRDDVRAALGSITSGGLPADEELQSAEMRRLVHVALDALPDRYARALGWKYLEDLKTEEIATRLDVSPKAAESVLTRARSAFRDALCALTDGQEGAVRMTP